MKNNINVCIIDDDDVFQYTILHTLQVHKSVNHIIPFTYDSVAMTFLKANINNDQELPDVIFLDINMTVMDGYGFMQQYESLIPNLAKKITVYILSSSVDLVDFDKTKKINQVTDYIVKPIRDNQLTRILAEL